MEIIIDDKIKLAQVWLTAEEAADHVLRDRLKLFYLHCKQGKYKVAVFESGAGDLVHSTAAVLVHNRDIPQQSPDSVTA